MATLNVYTKAIEAFARQKVCKRSTKTTVALPMGSFRFFKNENTIRLAEKDGKTVDNIAVFSSKRQATIFFVEATEHSNRIYTAQAVVKF